MKTLENICPDEVENIGIRISATKDDEGDVDDLY